MNKTDRLLLNKVHIFFAECYENKTIMNPQELSTMFCKIFNDDITYIKLCPDGLENSLMSLVEDIKNNMSNEFKQSLKVLITSYYDTLNYEKIRNSNMPIKDKDRYWFKCLLSKYVLENLLFRDNVNTLKNFQSECIQLSSLIGNFYSEQDSDKASVTKNIINSKLNDIFTRYDYKFELPGLSA